MKMKSFTPIFIAAIMLAAVLAIMAPEVALASNADAVRGGLGATGESGGEDINSLIQTIVNILSFIVGVVAVIMIIIAGFKYVTSNGDSNSIASAKNTIIYAVVGIVVAIMAQVIVRFVVDEVTGTGSSSQTETSGEGADGGATPSPSPVTPPPADGVDE